MSFTNSRKCWIDMKKLSISMSRTETVLGWGYFVFQLLFLGVILIAVNSFLPDPMDATELNILLFIINFACIMLIFPKFLWKNLQASLNSFFITLKSAGIGFVLYYGSSMLVNLLVFTINPDFSNANDSNISQMLRGNFTLMGICTVLLVPIVEETLYRGLIFRTLYNKNALLGYTLSTALFALIHVIGYIGSYDTLTLALCFLQYIPAGICLAWAYVRADSILAPILIHMTVNQVGILAMR